MGIVIQNICIQILSIRILIRSIRILIRSIRIIFMSNLKSQIESLLFIAAKPMALSQLCDLLKKDKEDVKKAGDELVLEYKSNQKGVQIIKNGSKYQMVSSPENAKAVQDFIKDETTGELSRPSLEALTIIAYRGPVSKIDLDRIRGVNCALIIRNLLLRGLVEAKFNKQKNETYYTITFDFIRFLGVNDVSELPDYERLSKDDSITRFLNNAPDAGDVPADTSEFSGETESESGIENQESGNSAERDDENYEDDEVEDEDELVSEIIDEIENELKDEEIE